MVGRHAACLDSRIDKVTTVDSIRSWLKDVIATPRDIHAISHVVPGALKTYDLPDLVTLLGDRLTPR